MGQAEQKSQAGNRRSVGRVSVFYLSLITRLAGRLALMALSRSRTRTREYITRKEAT